MPDNHVLFDVLRRFARTMTGHYDISDVLYELCDHAVVVLGAAGSGVSVFDDDAKLRFVTATDEAAVAVEKCQERLQAGPCYDSIEQRRPVPVSDIRDCKDTWPEYAETADEHGMSAVLGLPLMPWTAGSSSSRRRASSPARPT